jgi:hypothetical protein
MPIKQPQKTTKTQLMDSPFNPERYAASDDAKEWITSVIKEIEAYETKHQLRQRKRKLRDQELFIRQVDALLSDAAYTFLYQPKGRSGKVSMSLSKQRIGPKQDGHPLVNSTLSDTLERLRQEALDLLEVTKGSKQSGLQTAVGLSKKSQVRIRKLGLETQDFKTHKDRPLIELRGPKINGKKGKRLPLDMTNPEIVRMCKELELINEAISEADIKYIGADPNVDDRARRIHRVFNDGSMESYGLCYGGFWVPLGQKDRFASLLIDKESIVELDLSAALLQVAYAIKGFDSTEIDLYRIPNYGVVPREKMKRWILTYFNGGEKAFKSMPLGKTLHKKLQRNEDESESQTFNRLIADLKNFHKKIDDLFKPEKTPFIRYVQGQIMMDVLLKLMKGGIIALPNGDAIYVKESCKDKALKVFQECFNARTGVAAKITVSS